MPPRKRAAPGAAETNGEILPARRSSRRAAIDGSNKYPLPVSDGSSQAPHKRIKQSSKSAASRTAAPQDDANTKAAAKKLTKRSPKDLETSAREDKRASSEDPDVDSIPAINPEAPRHEGEWYWLMKAEPETRYENGIDVRFSIDDLRAKTKPEGWDGIRAYAARNHMRNMNAGDKAFFYHSNCKEPGIVGTMEVVKEFSEDVSARRPGTPYYDAQSTKDKPRWSLVHVEFRRKFAVPITLKELRAMGKPGGPLENMQMLKQSRLSVSRVSTGEWEELCRVADEKAREARLEHETDKVKST
ncbi:thymocyte nuclear protein 1 [Metarhizium rileyi]|uniref:Thymocyte nuclear protein 1 n=1 Tax=Metarhizium rileyi (strain RCEF 4871) TaxID=1649241 RepID=A0A167BY81_METRR|nr:thymocyte nuclear protein 1 [Metarhizium rileyi RCEF 4871]